jgi:uncharacterized membrane protein
VGRNRLEAFSDGMIAIFITIMVLEMKVPHGPELADLAGVWPTFLSYILSYVYLGIYWSNHHHLLHALDRVNGAILWANTHLMFWLSLVPFATGWMGENHFAPVPTAIYGAVMLMAAIAYWLLERVIIAAQGPGSRLQRAIGRHWKEKISPLFYAVGIVLACWFPWAALALYVAVATMWLVPDKRIEREVHASGK